MRKLLLLLSLAPCVALLAACPKKAGDADAAADAAEQPATVAVEAAAPAPVAKNASDVARFGTETAIANESTKLVASFTQARSSPRGGTIVATLKGGTDITKIAKHADTFLVTFADPKDANTVLMGWVGKEAFSPTIVDAGPKDAALDASRTLVCAPGTTAVFLGSDTVCKKKCNTDADCKNAAAGSCVVAAQIAAGGRAIHVCAND